MRVVCDRYKLLGVLEKGGHNQEMSRRNHVYASRNQCKASTEAFRPVYTGRQYVRVLEAFRSVYTGRQYVRV